MNIKKRQEQVISVAAVLVGLLELLGTIALLAASTLPGTPPPTGSANWFLGAGLLLFGGYLYWRAEKRR